MNIILYVLIPNLVVISFLLWSKSLPGSDHQIHVSIIDRIKFNKQRFLDDYILSINERYAWYPQLFHWVLSFFSKKIYKEKYKYINVFVKLIEIIAFNTFLFFLYQKIGFDQILFLYANIIVNVFPFSYALWNAKNNGLSGRGIGLVAGQIYTYLIVVYSITGNLLLLLPLFLSVFIILLLSLMAMQYVIFSSVLFVIFYGIPEIILLPFLAYGLFYAVMPKVAINNIIGQFNHKRNYALFDAEPFILKHRPSIYRDFIYDFWLKLRRNFKTGIVYVYKNPLVEIIYGMPFLWLVIYTNGKSKFEGELQLIFYAILVALCIFFITSFRWTRFLGEPQRYLEFVIPLITILYVLNFGILSHILLTAVCVGVILSSSFVLYRHKETKTNNVNSAAFVSFIENNNQYQGKICISNDNELVKYLTGNGIKVLRPDYSIYIKDKEEYYKNYIDNNLYILSPSVLKEYYKRYNVEVLIINTDLYVLETLLETLKPTKMNLVKKIGNYELYEL